MGVCNRYSGIDYSKSTKVDAEMFLQFEYPVILVDTSEFPPRKIPRGP